MSKVDGQAPHKHFRDIYHLVRQHDMQDCHPDEPANAGPTRATQKGPDKLVH